MIALIATIAIFWFVLEGIPALFERKDDEGNQWK